MLSRKIVSLILLVFLAVAAPVTTSLVLNLEEPVLVADGSDPPPPPVKG